MQYSLSVRRTQRVANRSADVDNLRDIESSAGEPPLQRFALQQFHDEVMNLFPGQRSRLADIVNRADVRMAEGCHRFGFSLKSFERLRRSRELCREDFDRDEALQAGVQRAINLS